MQLDNHDANLSTFCNISGLCQEEERALTEVFLLIEADLPQLTDEFYRQLLGDAQTAPYLEGRIEALKQTHLTWIRDLVGGVHDAAFISRQEKIGEVHVTMRIPPLFVASSMSHLRAAMPLLIQRKVDDSAKAGQATKALLQLLDLCHYLIDRKYSETLMNNLGISPALLNRLQTLK